jgi:hypothetical protein
VRTLALAPDRSHGRRREEYGRVDAVPVSAAGKQAVGAWPAVTSVVLLIAGEALMQAMTGVERRTTVVRLEAGPVAARAPGGAGHL